LPPSAVGAPQRVFRPAVRDLSVAMCRSLHKKHVALKQEKHMENAEPNAPIEDDVLHLGSPTKLSPEEIAKAIAHHDRHHHGDQPQQAAAKNAPGKKKK